MHDLQLQEDSRVSKQPVLALVLVPVNLRVLLFTFVSKCST